MILMVIAFRARNDGETAVHLLSTAISLAQTMGIHRKSDRIYTPRSDSESVEFRSNCWWTIYVLDQVLALELERRPIVDERDCDLSPPRHSNYQVAPNVSNTIFTELVKLAKVQSIVNAELHKGRQAEESESINVQDVIAKKIKTAGELDMKLTDWEASLPISLRPSELSYSSPGILPAAAFLAMQYYQTLFLVSRNALIVNEKQVQHLIDTKLSKENPALRIRNGKALCSNLVRSIISLLGLIRDNNAQSVFDTVYSPLVAAIGLAISIIRSPSASNARMDLALYKIAVSSIHDREQSFASSHHNGPMKLSTLLGKLEPDLATRIERAADHDTTSLPADAFEATTRANEESTTTHRHGQLSGQHHADLGDASLDTGIEAFDASSLWDQDFSGILDGNLDFGDDGWATLAEALDLPSVRFDNSPVQTI
ncbi:Fungal specific transcription factor domain-containing protein 31 [Elsinoe fawcettii]|nr:Fungal specific transcription factor domain-containing protein 31 [Elsinoe fawcettii]